MPDTVMSTETPAERYSTAKIAAALALAQKNFAPIPKDREVTVHSDRGNYKFKYATMDAICKATMPALAEQGIAIIQGMIEREQGYAVETTLLHSSGERLGNVTPMFVSGRVKDGRQYPPTNQELGSAQTYARRYGLSALLCITADEDDDGNTADGNHIEGSQRTPYKPAKGSAGGGGDFRSGTRSGGNFVEEARRDGLLDETRAKGTLPGKKLSAAENAAQWTDKAIETLNLSGQTKDSISAFCKENADKIEWLEEKAPDQFERFTVALDNATESAAVKAA